MKYFLHDTCSFQDEKITVLFMEHGYEGLGLFYTILEKLAMQEKPVNTIVLKKQLFITKKLEKVWSFLEKTELIFTKNGETFNENLLKFSEKYQVKKEKNKKRILDWRTSKASPKNVTRYRIVTDHVTERVTLPFCNAPKVNKSKVNLSKGIIEVNTSIPAPKKSPDHALTQFDFFWDIYNKPVDKAKCKAKFLKLPEISRLKIMDTVSSYVKSTPDRQYRKNPLTWLNGKCWEDVMITANSQPFTGKVLTPDDFYNDADYQAYCIKNNLTPAA